MAAGPKLCPCCSKTLSTQQISCHQVLCQQDLDTLDESDGLNPNSDKSDTAPGDAGPAPNDAAPALDNMGEDLGGNNGGDAMGMEEDGVSPEPPDSVANMSIDIDNARALPPELPPAQGLRRNPPVTIEDWPDPDDDFAASDDGNNGTLIDDADRDPEYVERDAPLVFDPDDEPVLDDEEIWAFLEDHLGDLTDKEWIDMCEF
ncbi:hypothetical protein FRC10_009390 [Ceratobasidium sp. 414]|nr:hypothetical protein FRC10_009390 [Ceratobasidium sp. 414]